MHKADKVQGDELFRQAPPALPFESEAPGTPLMMALKLSILYFIAREKSNYCLRLSEIRKLGPVTTDLK